MTSRSEATAADPLDRTIDEVTRVLVDRLELQLEPSEIAPDANFLDDIGLDSAAVLELVIGLEEVFGIDFDIAGSEPENFQSVRCLARYVESRR